MKTKKNITLNLSDAERNSLRKHKVKKAAVLGYATDELARILDVPISRAREIQALADFQRIPSIGIQFAKDLVYLGYYSVASLQGQDGAQLTNAYERKKGYRTDVCVEDQFRLAVHVANTHDYTKNWWDFTAERKAYRQAEGYPQDRPKGHWFEASKP